MYLFSLSRLRYIISVSLSSALFLITHAQEQIQINDIAPEIMITDWIQNIPKDTSLTNKYIVLEFWATWCGPCLKAVPHLNELQEMFKRNDLIFLSMTNEKTELVKNTLKRFSFHSAVVSDQTSKTQTGFGDKKNGMVSLPMTVLIDKDEIIRWIGMPEDLNAAIMNDFLSGGKSLPVKEIARSTAQDSTSYLTEFKKIVNDESQKIYVDIRRCKNDENEFYSPDPNIIYYSPVSFRDICYSALNIKQYKIDIPDSINDIPLLLALKRKDSSRANDLIEQKMTDALGLIKTSTSVKIPLLTLAIKDRTNLEQNGNHIFSSISDAGKNKIMTGFTIREMASILSMTGPAEVRSEANDSNLYNFTINIRTKDEMIKSLRSYGFEIKESEIQETVFIYRKKK